VPPIEPRRIRTLIMGAAGRDFHNFNTVLRDDPRYDVIAFTATQIPDIAGRAYPGELAGPLYPDGIPIYSESELELLVRERAIDQVLFSYSDVSHAYVMDRASAVLSAGADFRLLGPGATMLRSRRPVVAVTAVRTGCGKSQTTRVLVGALRQAGRQVVVVRHPMPYGDLAAQAVQRFETLDDLELHRVTIEEREEYEPHLQAGSVVFAGVDFQRILAAAEEEADVVLWDGGNNDLPFYAPDVHIVVLDPLRPGHERTFYPGQVNLRMADIAIISKVDGATAEQMDEVRRSLDELNPTAQRFEAESPVSVLEPGRIAGRRVVVVEDGPSVTHGGMAFGAGLVAARAEGAAAIVDPRPYAVGSIAATYAEYPDTGPVLPAMGYSQAQVRDLQETLARVPADVVVIGTPIDLVRLVRIDKPTVRVQYDLRVVKGGDLGAAVLSRLERVPA
jgi:predicted GTPase